MFCVCVCVCIRVSHFVWAKNNPSWLGHFRESFFWSLFFGGRGPNWGYEIPVTQRFVFLIASIAHCFVFLGALSQKKIRKNNKKHEGLKRFFF